MCTLGLISDLIEGGQPRVKLCLRKVKLNHILRMVFIKLVNPRVCVRPCLK